MQRLIVVCCLVLTFAAVACETTKWNQEEVIHELEAIAVGTSREEIESALKQIDLDYVYVPRSLLERAREATFESTPLSGRIQVTLPEDKSLFWILKGHADIDLDERERMVRIRITRGWAPRTIGD